MGGADGVVIAGLGSLYRHDDAVGVIVGEEAARAVGTRCIGPLVDPLDLLGRWDDASLAVVIDAVRSGTEPGTIRVLHLATEDLAGPETGAVVPDGGPAGRTESRHRATSSHGIDVLGVHRLARAVGGAPDRVVLVGIEGEDFSPGVGLSDPVRAAVPDAVRAVLAVVQEARTCA